MPSAKAKGTSCPTEDCMRALSMSEAGPVESTKSPLVPISSYWPTPSLLRTWGRWEGQKYKLPCEGNIKYTAFHLYIYSISVHIPVYTWKTSKLASPVRQIVSKHWINTIDWKERLINLITKSILCMVQKCTECPAQAICNSVKIFPQNILRVPSGHDNDLTLIGLIIHQRMWWTKHHQFPE